MTSSAWILRTVEALNIAGSWSGRIHIHKALFIGERLSHLQHPFAFELYRFGPYSFDLDSAIRDLEICGLLEKEFPKANYGARYHPIEDWQKSLHEDITASEQKKLSRVVSAIGARESSDLELIATCLWVEEQGITSDDEIIGRVGQIKPKYPESYIRSQLAALRSLQTQLD